MIYALRTIALGIAAFVLVARPSFAADPPASVFGTPAAMRPPEMVHGQPSFVLENDDTWVAVTETGGHMIATFSYKTKAPMISPYHVSPWQEEGKKIEPAILNVLRGDFFCMPFGGNAEAFNGEQHPPHGETANSTWKLLTNTKDGKVSRLVLRMETKVRPGTVTKELTLVEGHPVIYSRHTIDGFAGPVPLGHHATLALPKTDGALRVSTSKLRYGLTNPTQFSDPAKGEYQALEIGATFDDLARVPSIFKNTPDADCTRFPARKGFADLLCVINEPNGPNEPAWVAAVNNESNYLWFALKDPAVLPSLLFWIENHGRHGAPWSGRNNCLGLEDVCTYFADGVAPSAKENGLAKLGIATTMPLAAGRSVQIDYIQGAVAVPPGFEKVEHVEFAPGQAKFVGVGGKEVVVKVNHEMVARPKAEAPPSTESKRAAP